MREYPFEKYKFVVDEEHGRVYAITNDAGESIRGMATCCEQDKFDVEFGKQLAAARANEKVAIRKHKRAKKAMEDAACLMDYANMIFSGAKVFLQDTEENLAAAKKKTAKLSKK